MGHGMGFAEARLVSDHLPPCSLRRPSRDTLFMVPDRSTQWSTSPNSAAAEANSLSCPGTGLIFCTRRAGVVRKTLSVGFLSFLGPCLFQVEAVLEIDSHSQQRLQYQAGGWNFWEWQNHRIHYIAAGSIWTSAQSRASQSCTVTCP